MVGLLTAREGWRMDALVGSPETSDLTCAILRAFPRVRFETIALLAGSPRPFLLAEFREISLRSARVWL